MGNLKNDKKFRLTSHLKRICTQIDLQSYLLRKTNYLYLQLMVLSNLWGQKVISVNSFQDVVNRHFFLRDFGSRHCWSVRKWFLLNLEVVMSVTYFFVKRVFERRQIIVLNLTFQYCFSCNWQLPIHFIVERRMALKTLLLLGKFLILTSSNMIH